MMQQHKRDGRGREQCGSEEETSLFDVYLRLRPSLSEDAAESDGRGPFLTVEPPCSAPETGCDSALEAASWPTHITVQPPVDSRKRAIERFTFTKVFEEPAEQLDLFTDTGIPQVIGGVLNEGRDGLIAALGVTGSGKTHTILGSKGQRGILQLCLDVLYTSLAATICTIDDDPSASITAAELSAADPSEAQISSARSFLETVYLDPYGEKSRYARPPTPLIQQDSESSDTVRKTPVHPPRFRPLSPTPEEDPGNEAATSTSTTSTIRLVASNKPIAPREIKRSSALPRTLPTSKPWKPILPTVNRTSNSSRFVRPKESGHHVSRRTPLMRPSYLPNVPDVSDLTLSDIKGDQHIILLSMWEIHNDRIYDLLSSISESISNTSGRPHKTTQRRPLAFKHTESSTDSKVVAGLKKIVCGTYDEALMVLEAGLTERKVSCTESNLASSRSHGFFCVEVKKKVNGRRGQSAMWIGNSLTIVDLAGSERARNARTTGATLAEAGKINESLMYLGQCLQMQSEIRGDKKKALMIVTADRWGDFSATSQILRYSALAKEVSVPRGPSLRQSILSDGSRPSSASGNTSSRAAQYLEELELAEEEVNRLNEAYEALALRLSEEEYARAEAEFRWKAAEERCLLVEQEVREECWEEMEQRLSEEISRWKQAWECQARRHDEHLDRKLDLLSREVMIYEDPGPSAEDKDEELRTENESLRRRIIRFERQMHCQSPTKSPSKNRLKARTLAKSNSSGPSDDVENTVCHFSGLKLDRQPT
ncbi:hypothetical protein KEM56_007784 [Ascosphaera pollenicola]|nr:hypothetical protein KEM56_007784 [Ascosphaera pollenicola]